MLSDKLDVMTRNALPLLMFLASCKVTDPLYCDLDRPCTDPDRPFCDLAGAYPASGGIGHTCIADPGSGTVADAALGDAAPGDGAPIACDDPGEALECAADTLILCSNDRQEQQIACPLGCAEKEVRCLDVQPSNDLAAYLDLAAEAQPLEFTGDALLDTDSGNLIDAEDNQILVQTFLLDAPYRGVPVRVIVARSVDIGSLRALGVPALAIVADGDIRVRGRLSVASDRRAGTQGDGAGRRTYPEECAGERGETGQIGSIVQQGGNGGGGHGTSGAAGGAVQGIAAGGAAGEAVGIPGIVPLAGGCSGHGGDGGGAVQLVSRTSIEVLDGAIVSANGSGGRQPGPGPGKKHPPGGGGGAGGAILIEAPSISVRGGLFANGGGGAGLCFGGGEDGREDLTQASGDECDNPNYGDGGLGWLPDGDLPLPAMVSIRLR